MAPWSVSRAGKYATLLALFLLVRGRVRRWRRSDLIVHGNFRALESVLTALLSRGVTLPLLRFARWVCRCV
jgi:hypothetical protein